MIPIAFQPLQFQPLADHLWQSTWLAGLAGLFTLLLRKNRAQTRYRLWLAASMKFLLPFSLLVDLGARFGWRTAPVVAPAGGMAVMDQVSRPFAAHGALPGASVVHAAPASPMAAILLSIWAAGFLALMAHWWLRWRRVRAALATAARVDLPIELEARTSPEFAEPGIFGIGRPVLLLPHGVQSHLTAQQWEAILRHELCHVRRRDNLATAIHMLVERIFWFHPLVWWLGGRLMEERERACDEEVLRLGSAPEAYAEGILRVCELYLQSPMPCVSGVGGANLKQRIEGIMSNRTVLGLNVAKKAVLTVAGMAALMAPVVIGMMNAPARAQDQKREQKPAAPLAFDSASVKVSRDYDSGTHVHQNGAQLTMENVTLKSVIQRAWEMTDDHVVGPAWLDSERYDIAAKAVGDDARNEYPLRLQTLLKERFKLAVHMESREAPVYELVVAKNGLKVKPDAVASAISGNDSDQYGVVMFKSVSMERLAKWLGRPRGVSLGRSVIDKTGLTGTYTFTLHWSLDDVLGASADKAADEGAAILAAMQDQLGLKMEAKKAQVQFLVVDRAEKVPTEN